MPVLSESEQEVARLQQRVADLETDAAKLRLERVALEKANERFTLAVRAAGLGVWDWNIEQDILTWDEQMYRLYGIEHAGGPVAYQVWLDHVHPEDAAASDAKIEAALLGLGEYVMEFRVNRPDGTIGYIRAVGVVIRDAQGRAVRMAGINEDITAQKIAERESTLKDRLLRLTGEMGKIGGWEFDAATGAGTWTDEVAHIHEMDPSDTTSRGLGVSFYVPESRARIEAAIAKAIDQAEPYDLELEMEVPSGAHKWVRTMALPIIEDGRVTRLRGIFQDITAARQASEALRRSEALYRTITRNIPGGGFCVIDHDLRLIAAEGSLTDDLGVSKEQMVGKTIDQVFDHNHLGRVKEGFEIALAGQKSSHEIQIGERVIWSQYVPLVDENGVILAGMALMVDITEQKRTEAHLRQIKRLYATLGQVNQAIVRVRDPKALYDQICQIAIEFGEFRLAWVGLVDPATGEVEIQNGYARSDEDRLLEKVRAQHINRDDDTFAPTAIVRSLRTGKVVTINDIAAHPELRLWSGPALSIGLASLAVIPIFRGGAVIGVAVLYGEEKSSFEEEENNLLEEISLDISFGLELLDMEAQHRAAEERFSKAFQSSPAALAIIRQSDASFIDINSSFERVFGHTRDEALGRTPADLRMLENEADRETILAIIRQVNRQKDVEARLRVKSGEVREMMVSNDMIDLHGEACTLASIEDITERKRADEALREAKQRAEESEARYRLLAENSLDVIWVADMEEQKFTYISPSILQLRGITAEEALHETPEQSLMPGEFAKLRVTIAQRIDEFTRGVERYYIDELEQPRADGSTVIVEVTSRYMKNPESGHLEVYATSRNITERKQAEKMIQAALEEKVTLLREVHHRVKNNLQAIIALINMQSIHMQDESTRQFLRELEGQARTMSLVYEQLYQSENLSRVDIAPYFHQLTGSILQTFGFGREIRLELDIAPIYMDVALAMPCGLIVNELVTNCLKHAFPKGWQVGADGQPPAIRVILREEQPGYCLRVKDNGVGLPDQFNWEDSDTLGLQLVNLWATHQLGGKIEVHVSNGTEFIIRVPLKGEYL